MTPAFKRAPLGRARPSAAVAANLTTTGQVLNSTALAVTNINNSISNVNEVLTGNSSLAGLVDGGLDTIPADTFDTLEAGGDAVDDAVDLIGESAQTFEE